MDGNFKRYSYQASKDRIASILDQPAGMFEEVNDLPSRDSLTYTNGFYGYCSAIFVDIRSSSKMTEKYTRPRLAKIYRTFISEMVAVLNSDQFVREVNIVGDCVWAVYRTPNKPDIDDIFSIVSYANTLIRLINVEMARRDYGTELRTGIGADYGRVLMIKSGFSGSGINDVVYMGDVVNRAAHLAHQAHRGMNEPIFIGETFAGNLNDHNQGLLKKQFSFELGSYRAGNFINTVMNDWVSDL